MGLVTGVFGLGIVSARFCHHVPLHYLHAKICQRFQGMIVAAPVRQPKQRWHGGDGGFGLALCIGLALGLLAQQLVLRLSPQNLSAKPRGRKQGKIAVRPSVVGDFKLGLTHDLHHPAGVGAHPFAPHKERGGYVFGTQKTEDFHVAARGDRIQLAQVKGEGNHLGSVGNGNTPNSAHICGRERGQHGGGFAPSWRRSIVGQGLAGVLRVWLPRG